MSCIQPTLRGCYSRHRAASWKLVRVRTRETESSNRRIRSASFLPERLWTFRSTVEEVIDVSTYGWWHELAQGVNDDEAKIGAPCVVDIPYR